MAEMGIVVGVLPDRSKVTISLRQGNKDLGWIEYDGPGCDRFLSLVVQYRAMLTDVLPAPQKANGSLA
jgi:hypothetical protein